MRIFWLILLTFWVSKSIASEVSKIQHRSIEVSGVGSVLSVPDRFSFKLTIEQKGEGAAELNTVIVEKTNQVVQALIKIGVDKKAIQSMQVQFRPWVEYDGKTQQQKGFILTRQVSVTLQTLAQYEQAIDTVLALGVSTINQFSFTDSQASEHYQVALTQALRNAKYRAKNMLDVLGLNLGAVVSIYEQSSGQATPMAMQGRQFKASESYQPGEMSTQARVKVIFALQDKP